jgi:hypothetical protein
METEAPLMFNRRLLYATLISILAILFHANALAQSDDRSQVIKDVTSLGKDLKEKEKLFLSPSDKDQAKFAEFLKQPDTGLIRLLPRGLYDDRLTIRGGGAYYSFALSTNEYGRGSDISLEKIQSYDYEPPPIANYVFQTGFAGANGGFIVRLGNIPLDKVTLDHKGVKFLAGFIPPSTVPEARAVFRRDYAGIRENRFEYKWRSLVIVNYTYALRSINYDTSDVLVAFRVVRKEIDGSVVILWKMLKRFPTPELQR